METKPVKNWWFLLVNGIIAFVFGLMLMLYTRDSILAALSFFGVVVLILGLLLLVASLINLKKDKQVAMLLFQSMITIGLGIFLLLAPENSLKIILILIGVWAVVLGVIQLVIMANIRQNLTNKNVFLFNGLLTIALGIVMFFNPFEFAVFLFRFIGFMIMLFGVILGYLAFIVRKVARATESVQEH